jgi:tetratricopeptide (TPR) repeat protein
VAADRGPTSARSALEEALETSPDDSDAALRLGQLEFSEGRLDRAEALFRKAAAGAGSGEALELLGLVLNRRGRFQEALTCLREATRLRPDSAIAWNSAGEALSRLGWLGEALDAFVRATRIDPAFCQAHYNAGLALRAMGKRDAAIQAFRAAVRLNPDFADAVQALGGLLHAVGRYQGAIDCFRVLVRLKPEDAVAYTSLGASAQMLGDMNTARACYERAVELSPQYPDAHSNLGTVYQAQRELDLAEECFRRALQIDPDHPDALGGLAASMDRKGRYEEALALLEPRLADGPVEMGVTGAQILGHLGRTDDAARLLQNLLQRKGITAPEKQRLDFILGATLDDLGRYEEAFAAFRAGNRGKPLRFDRNEYREDVRRLFEVFSADQWPRLKRIDDPSERPVFVVGMPRSGTSLVEQILTCHPQVAGAGELTEMGRAAIELGRDEGTRFPYSMLSAGEQRLRKAAGDYLDRLELASPDALRVTDKTPTNHLFIGFIQNLFPNARVIHCVRHPLDTCLSNYFQNFAGVGIPFSYDLGDLAVYYNDYLKVMEYWRAHAAIRMLDVVYEELVTDQERVCREMIEFLGLDWDAACLRFHESDRVVATASHAQVRRPMYRSSIGRFRHYEPWTRELVGAIDWEAWRRSGFAGRVDACLPGGG